MDMSGQQLIAASKQEVWSALNDPDVLKACIPGCQQLTKSSDTEMSAVAEMRVGPVKARFQGTVTLSELDPPNGYKISGEGQGGVAGFAKGVAVVRLDESEAGTALNYTVQAQIGGKLAQLGGRLIDVTAKQLSAQFFKKFADEIQYRQNPTNILSAIPGKGAETASASAPFRSTQVRADPAAAPIRSAPSTPPYRGALLTLPAIAAVVFVAVIVAMWAVFSGLLPNIGPIDSISNARTHISPDFSSAVQLVIVAAIGYLFGTRATRKD